MTLNEKMLYIFLTLGCLLGTYTYYGYDNNSNLDNLMNFVALSALVGLTLSSVGKVTYLLANLYEPKRLVIFIKSMGTMA